MMMRQQLKLLITLFQNTYTEVVGGDDDDSVEAAMGLQTSLYLHLCTK